MNIKNISFAVKWFPNHDAFTILFHATADKYGHSSTIMNSFNTGNAMMGLV